jgi:hypothetical protein
MAAQGDLLLRQISRDPDEILSFNLSKAGFLRRRLGIPNPAPFYELTRALDANWPSFGSFAHASPFSLSKPVLDRRGKRGLIPRVHPRYRLPRKVALRATGRFIAVTDISDFYASIYTHALPWALHSRVFAKTNRGPEYPGNRIDQLIRKSQSGQTKGIPIGPDTSFAIAEMLLSPIDRRLASHGARGLRNSDDYEIIADSRDEAEHWISELETILGEFELSINEAKTQIIQLPHFSEDEWVHPLNAIQFRSTPTGERTDLIRFFDTSFDLDRRFNGRHVLKYGLGRLLREKLRIGNFTLLQNLLMQTLGAGFDLLPSVLALFELYRQAGAVVDVDLLGEVLERHIIYCSQRSLDSEVAWAVWGAMSFGRRLGSEATKVLCQQENSVVALLALDANSRGLLDKSTYSTAVWQSLMNVEDLHGSQWLLSYEANFKGWLKSNGKRDHVRRDPFFRSLKAAGVYFYEQTPKASVLAQLVAYLTQRSPYAAPPALPVEIAKSSAPSS